MANTQRTRPPHPGPWETPNLRSDQQDTWLLRDWPIQIGNIISSTLKDALTKPNVVRLLRSDLSEWSNDVWHCYRLLGAGSFGTAAVWQSRDVDDRLLDEIVVKEDRKQGRSKYPSDAKLHGIFLPEAEIMQTLNTQSNSGNIVHMRGYKVFLRNPRANQRRRKKTDPIVHNEIHRFYLEYAPYGTLTNLALRYKAFNRYLPELFLWHVFNSLAKAAMTLEDLPNNDECYVHLDLKPDNVFLGYENAKALNPNATGGLDGEAVNYPSVKLGDFGVAEKVNKGENDGLQETAGVGTACFKAPEVIRATGDEIEGPGQYGADWYPPLNRPEDSLTSKADIWAIGKVMYDLFSLSRPRTLNHLQANTRADYTKNGDKMIPDFHSTPFILDDLHKKSPYTKDLSDVIESCMRGEASLRPSPTNLYATTTRLLRQRYAEMPSTLPCTVRNRKLYYRGNEINDMSIEARNCGHSITIFDWADLVAPGNNDPNEPKLDIYPAQMWEMRRSEEHRNEAFELYQDSLQTPLETERFRELLLENEERLRLGQLEIEFLDPDLELTYQGRKDAASFVEEGEKRRKNGARARRRQDGNGSSNNHQDDDHNDDDGNQGAGRGLRSRSGAGLPAKPANQPSKRTQAPPRKHNRRGKNEVLPVLGEGFASQQRALKFTPYIPIEANQERFENTADGRDLVFVIDTQPDPSLIPNSLSVVNPSRTRKRAVEVLETPLAGQGSRFDSGETTSRVQNVKEPNEQVHESKKRQRLATRTSKGSNAPQQPRRSVRNAQLSKLSKRKAK